MELLDSFIFISLVKAAVIFAVLMTPLAYLQWVERKVIAHIQVRPGPYRVGPHGLLQPLADVIKLITKEDLIPPYVNKPLYLAAPFLAITMALLSISVIPFGPAIEVFGYPTLMQLTDYNMVVLFVLAGSSIGVYGIALAGWSSNNKYALLGGLHGNAAVSGRVDCALARGIRVEPGTQHDLCAGGRSGVVPCGAPGAAPRSLVAGGCGRGVPVDCGGVPAAHGAGLADAALLV